ncbi:MAG: hypothetical protein VB036_02540 [Propionicimonas sp.]|nr:hypothetical protein [Propionicimonas sp.]
MIVTFNTKDLPPGVVADSGIAVVHPADFLLDQLNLHPRLVQDALLAQVAVSRRPLLSYPEVLTRLRRYGVGAFVDELRRRFGEELDMPAVDGKRFRRD